MVTKRRKLRPHPIDPPAHAFPEATFKSGFFGILLNALLVVSILAQFGMMYFPARNKTYLGIPGRALGCICDVGCFADRGAIGIESWWETAASRRAAACYFWFGG